MVAGTGLVYGQAQNNTNDLVQQGIGLTSQKKYTDAIEKFRAALGVDSNHIQANYQLAFTLFSSGKNMEAIPYIKRTIRLSTNAKFTAAAYSLSGSIYSSSNQLLNAIEAYRKGIAADTTNQRIYYNLGIAYFRNKQYNEAGLTFAAAITKDANDAGSTRMYALAAFHQNKRLEAVYGFCRFLTLQPNSPQSSEAFNNLQNILQGGQLKPEPGYKPSSAALTEANRQKLLLKKALSPLASRRYSSSADLLAGQLSAVFSVNDTSIGQFLFSGYFNQLSQTENMPAFVRYISQPANAANAKWLMDNPEKAKALNNWVAANQPAY
ncbi:hypothetical protein A0256_07065 [Mucilaginibacter sp. PAMC 26640]|nr:hypothetical protein A0256_07065 [Mucilaginibacter sp. PAMC 26640]